MGNPSSKEQTHIAARAFRIKGQWDHLEIPVDGLTTHPLTKLERVNLADDPIPFIKLVNPPAALTLSVESSLGSLFARRPW